MDEKTYKTFKHFIKKIFLFCLSHQYTQFLAKKQLNFLKKPSKIVGTDKLKICLEKRQSEYFCIYPNSTEIK